MRSFDESSTATTYQIEDGTGLIEVKEWMNDDCAGLAEMRQETMKENVYICVVGQVKEYDSKKSIVGNNVRVIESSNELTHHMLEAVYSAEKYKRGTQIVGAPQQAFGASSGVGFGGPVGGPKAGMGGMGISTGAGAGLNQMVLQYVREKGESSDEGVNIGQIIADVTASGQCTEAELRGVVESLATEGEIYSTIDENTFKVAE